MLMINNDNDNVNPYHNLALEEYLLKEFTDECFMLWKNSASIIIGKNQNTLSEVNVEYVNANKIPVVRRLSGGGAVFHDLGNLNFTFIINDMENSFINFKKFTLPIIEVLNKLSVNAELSGRNDLTIDGRKFSGNAQYKYKNRLLHHGTLLFSSNITDLSAALNVNRSKFEGKSVKSVISRVTNISSHLKQPLTIDEFKKEITDHIMSKYEDCTLYNLTTNDIKAVNELVKEKYSTWEWNYGSSPAYNFRNQKKLAGGIIEACLNVTNGYIKEIKFYGDFFSKQDIGDIEQALSGAKHDEESMRQVLGNFDINDYFANITLEEIIGLILNF